MKKGKWDSTVIIELGDKFEFCVVNKEGISEVHYGKVIAIDDTTRTFMISIRDSRMESHRSPRRIPSISRATGPLAGM